MPPSLDESHSAVRHGVPDGSLTRSPTRTGADGELRSPGDARVPGLTVLYHPDLDRVGERTPLPSLAAGGEARLSRKEPLFAAPAAGPATGAATGPGRQRDARPLADSALSRTPILLRGLPGGGVHLLPGESRTRVERIDERGAERVDETEGALVPPEKLESGAVLLLSGRVVLLLHRLDPAADTSTPRFRMVGESPGIARVRRDVVRTADLDVPLLIRGESGSGKELVARAVHDAGPRRERPYVAVNLAAVPASLAAAELFGAERGAYTGAQKRRPGHFERARGGTLFLDEVGETPTEVQALLLRALETGEIQSVGGERAERMDVRVISATDADLEGAIDGERFRAPLLHRLSGYVIRLPALRERREDFGRLFAFFLRRELGELGQMHTLSPERSRPWIPAPLVARLAAWHWPGNVRQLSNVVRQLVIANRGAEEATRFDEVETLLARRARAAADPARTAQAALDETQPLSGPSPAAPLPSPDPPNKAPRTAADLTEAEIVTALREHRFRPAAAADALGIPRPSLYDRMAKIPGLRKASDLDADEIRAARERHGPSVEAMAMALEVSERALRRRMGELGLV